MLEGIKSFYENASASVWVSGELSEKKKKKKKAEEEEEEKKKKKKMMNKEI